MLALQLGEHHGQSRLTGHLLDAPDDLNFIIPWSTVSVVLIATVIAALLMTWIPARQASRIAPAEALRYE